MLPWKPALGVRADDVFALLRHTKIPVQRGYFGQIDVVRLISRSAGSGFHSATSRLLMTRPGNYYIYKPGRDSAVIHKTVNSQPCALRDTYLTRL